MNFLLLLSVCVGRRTRTLYRYRSNELAVPTNFLRQKVKKIHNACCQIKPKIPPRLNVFAALFGKIADINIVSMQALV